jgi:hypothetical protein
MKYLPVCVLLPMRIKNEKKHEIWRGAISEVGYDGCFENDMRNGSGIRSSCYGLSLIMRHET